MKRHPAQKEYDRYMHWVGPWQSSVWRLMARNAQGESSLVSFRSDLHHGTPTEGLCSMFENGFQPQPHGILPGDWFCVSPNYSMLKNFGEIDSGRENGVLAEDCHLPNCIKLEPFHICFLESMTAGDPRLWEQMKDSYDLSDKLKRWMIKNELIDYDKNISSCYVDKSVDNSFWNRFPPNIYGLIWPECHKNLFVNNIGQDVWLGSHEDNEAEISLTAFGAKHFQKSVTSVFIDGEQISVDKFKEKFQLAA